MGSPCCSRLRCSKRCQTLLLYFVSAAVPLMCVFDLFSNMIMVFSRARVIWLFYPKCAKGGDCYFSKIMIGIHFGKTNLAATC